MRSVRIKLFCLAAGFGLSMVGQSVTAQPLSLPGKNPLASGRDKKPGIRWRGKIFVDWKGRRHWTYSKYKECSANSRVKMVQTLEIKEELSPLPEAYNRSWLKVVRGKYDVQCHLENSDYEIQPNPIKLSGRLSEKLLRDNRGAGNAGGMTFFERPAAGAPAKDRSKRRISYYLPSVAITKFAEKFKSPPHVDRAPHLVQLEMTPIRDSYGRPVRNKPFQYKVHWEPSTIIGTIPDFPINTFSLHDSRTRYFQKKRRVMRGQFTRPKQSSRSDVGVGVAVDPPPNVNHVTFGEAKFFFPPSPKPLPKLPQKYNRQSSRLAVRWYFKRDPMPVELELTACPEDWVPDIRGSKSQVRFKASIVKPKNLAAKWKFVLFKQSRLRGVCNNAFMPKALRKQWNKGGQRYEDGRRHKGKNDPDLLFDFRRYDGSDGVFKSVKKRPWQVLKTEQELNEVEFVVNSLDYGAYGKLTAAAYIDGRWRWLKAGEVKETKEKFARIPRDNSAPADGPYIAPAAVSDVTGVSYAGRKPNDDDDSQPRGRACCKGDGLSVFEEYRGFVARGFSEEKKAKPIFQRLDPTWKDLFVRIDQADRPMLAPYVFDFLMASELAVHTVTPQSKGQPFIRPSRVINFLSNKKHGIERQHALYMSDKRLPGSLLGRSTGIGPPKYVGRTIIDLHKLRDRWLKLAAKFGGDSTSTISWSEFDAFLSRTIVHELGHGVGIEHHGDGNRDVVKLGGKTYKKVAVEGGESSGNTDCAMRYIFWKYYLRKKAGSTPQLFDMSQEILNNRFCSDKLGTGFNDTSTPGYIFGDAARGNCKGQIVVNDRCPQPGGRSGNLEAGGDFDADEADDADDDIPAEDPEVARSQEEAGVVLELSVDGPHRGEVVPGEAILMKFSLRGRDAGDVPWGAEPAEAGPAKVTPFGSNDSPWTKQVEFVTRDENGKWVPAPVKVQPVGSVQRLTIQPRTPKSPAGIRLVDVADPVVSPTPDATYLATFAIVSTATEALPKGKLRIYASLPVTSEAGKKQGGRRVLSGSIVLDVIDPEKLPPREKQAVAFRRKLSKARLAMASNRYQQSEELARAVITEEPDSVEACLLLADSLLMQKKLKEAYEEYERALDHFNPDEVKPGGQGIQEPPELLLFTLYILKKRLAANP